MKACCLISLLALACLNSGLRAATPVSAPRVGLVRYADGGIHSLYGVAGNYVVGPRLLDSADGLSFSEAGGLLVRQGALQLIDSNLQTISSFNIGTEKPVLAIDRTLDSAIAWLPAHHLLVNSNGTALVPMTIPDGSWQGQVIGLQKISSDVASLLLLNAETGSVEEARVSLGTGSVLSVSSFAGVTGPVFRQADTLVSLHSGTLIITSVSTGAIQFFPIHAKDLTFERLSRDAIHLYSPSSGRDWILHVSARQPANQSSLFELPPPPSGAAQ